MVLTQNNTMAVGPILSWFLQSNKHREDWNEMVPNFIPELYARVSNKTRLIFYHWLHYHYYSRILLQSFLFIDACHWARYAFPSYFVVALTPPPCAHRRDTTECTPMPEQRWPSPELGPTDPCPPAQHREAVIAKRCFLPCLWWLDLGQHVFDLWVLVLEEEGWKGSQYFVTFIFYLFQMLTSSISERSLREVLINEPDWEDGRCVTRVYNTAIKWSSEPQCVRVSASATSWEWRSIGSSSDF